MIIHTSSTNIWRYVAVNPMLSYLLFRKTFWVLATRLDNVHQISIYSVGKWHYQFITFKLHPTGLCSKCADKINITDLSELICLWFGYKYMLKLELGKNTKFLWIPWKYQWAVAGWIISDLPGNNIHCHFMAEYSVTRSIPWSHMLQLLSSPVAPVTNMD